MLGQEVSYLPTIPVDEPIHMRRASLCRSTNKVRLVKKAKLERQGSAGDSPFVVKSARQEIIHWLTY